MCRGHRKLSCIAIRRATSVRARPEKSQSESIERDREESPLYTCNYAQQKKRAMLVVHSRLTALLTPLMDSL